jgi:hypothetical protein
MGRYICLTGALQEEANLVFPIGRSLVDLECWVFSHLRYLI